MSDPGEALPRLAGADAKPDPQWRAALQALAIFAVDPLGLGGVLLRGRAGPVRDRWVAQLRARLEEARPWRKVPVNVGDERLLGGLDLAATLAAGTPVAATGLMAEADGGVLQLVMAERLEPAAAARIAGALDTGEIAVEREGLSSRAAARFGVIAQDESGADDDGPPSALTDRLALHLDVAGVAPHASEAEAASPRAIAMARQRLAQVETPDAILDALCAAAQQLGVQSMRAPILALRAARAAAALAGRDRVAEDDATAAAQLVLTPRATQVPASPDEPAEPEPEPPRDPAPQDQSPQDQADDPESAEPPPEAGADPAPPPPPESGGDDAEDEQTPDAETLSETVVAAAASALQPGQLERIKLQAQQRAGGAMGRSGALVRAKRRGRRVGTRMGAPGPGEKLDVVETLRAAAPWQRLRGRAAQGPDGRPGRVIVKPDDFRVARLKHKTETATIFVVDASGSAALHRLGESKGAVELLLADCYVRRDRVALVTFRGTGAEVLLPPTRSLTRAKRSLAELPGGGGTPLAAGIEAGLDLAADVARRGETPVLIVMTDGRANVASDGTGDRTRAREESHTAAKQVRAAGVAAMLVDTSPRPRPGARELAQEMGAQYLPLPHADAASLSAAVKAGEAGLRAGARA
jgi:magnesium chelatase subunit D